MTDSFWRGIQRKRWLLLLPVVICLASVHLFPNQVLTWLDQKCFDLVISLRGKPVPAHPAVVIAKDQVFRERFGRDPDRADMARILEMLASAGASVAALDFIYDDRQTPENDLALRSAFARMPASIVAERFTSKAGFSGLENFAWRPTSGRPPAPAGLYEPVVGAACERGLINVFLGFDEMIRVMPLAFLPAEMSEFRPSLGFAAWVNWLLETAPKPDLLGILAREPLSGTPVSPEMMIVSAFGQAPHPFRGLGHAGLDRLIRKREALWLSRCLARELPPGPLPALTPASWTAAALAASEKGLPDRTWLSLPMDPLPIIGTEEAPCLRLPLTKLQPPLSGDGLQTLSMGALLPSEADANSTVQAVRRSTLELNPDETSQIRTIPLAFDFEKPGNDAIEGQAIDFMGRPLKGVRAFCQKGSGNFWMTAETDVDGRFRLSGLPAGTYTVELVWHRGDLVQRLSLESPIGSAQPQRLAPARFFPAEIELVASCTATPYDRELIVLGDGLWVADSGPAGEVPFATPPAGVTLQFLDGDLQGRWDATGRLLGSASQPLARTRIALLEEGTPWKSTWKLRSPVKSGAAEIRIAGVPPSLGARIGLLRKAPSDGELKTVDLDLLVGTAGVIASLPPETDSDERPVRVKWLSDIAAVGSMAIDLLLLGGDGDCLEVPASLGESTIPAGKWRVFARQGVNRGTYDSLKALIGQKAVFIGTRLQEDQDFRICPLNFWDSSFPTIPGVNLHAHLFSALARGEFLRPTIFHYDRFPRAWPAVCLFLLLPLLIFLDETFARRGALWGGFAVLTSGGGWLGISLWLFAGNVLLPISLPLLCLGVFGVSRGYLAYAQSRQRERETRTTFGRFVSAQMVEEILRNPHALKPGGDKKELTVMFTDLAGFTSISEKLTPEELTALMNEYLGEMTRILFVHGGTLDKYIGDAIMGFWNHPAEQPDHALRSVRCAIEMQRRLEEMRKQWLARGLPEVSMRAGINTSDAVVGFIGSDVQMNFTCLGDGVNLASRLEGANKAYHTFMMMSESTRAKLPEGLIRSRLLDFLAVKGKEQPIKVFEIIGEKGQEDALWERVLPLYDAGIASYLARRWDDAETNFREVLALRPDDGPSLTYLERCAIFRESPPPEGWDGRFILKTK